MHPEDLVKDRFWRHIIDELHQNNFILKSQKLHPRRWALFYDRAATLIHKLWGDPDAVAALIVDQLEKQDLLSSGGSVVDLGCGTGLLTLELARRGYRVLAVDSSAEMINFLKKRLSGGMQVETVCSDFLAFCPSVPYDLCIAMNFPPLFSVRGVSQVERYASVRCSITLVDEALNADLEFRRKVAVDVLRVKPPNTGRLLVLWLVGLLLSRNILPNMKTLECSSRVEIEIKELLEFYKLYFAIFGVKNTTTERLFPLLLSRNTGETSQVTWERNMRFCLIWWW
ncbi:class I SAM-dependent methyltransferase [Thermodesulforhabdus norvegica]|uniref:Methyltransferase domain-containing protein n=1 Tax=Thermodesulforhabdus norvegica TaxID=39841 RepID=A0A1I4S716_9BACT|nr:class I SAM-dependent methyltransferase [Thermodesulforhabdus norvegica]SFM60249.1 Methyltransferase domain-containing protein [Thermodesulforhabdus norvegica]